ncbi:MAG: DnaJ domain-containing protein [Pseudomonadota bacterium]
MSLGFIALLFAGAAAGWLLLRVAGGQAAGADKNIAVLKVIIWLGLAAVLFAARLWPLAFMVLLAAGGVMAIEMWRANAIRTDGDGGDTSLPVKQKMTRDEAAAVLGVASDASADEITAAYRKLITQIHPDKGGTDYLAAKINEARDLMMAEFERSQ